MLEIGNRANILRPCLSTSRIPWWPLAEDGTMHHVLKNKEQLWFFCTERPKFQYSSQTQQDQIQFTHATHHESWKIQSDELWPCRALIQLQSYSASCPGSRVISNEKEHHARNSPAPQTVTKETFRKDQRVWFCCLLGQVIRLATSLYLLMLARIAVLKSTMPLMHKQQVIVL